MANAPWAENAHKVVVEFLRGGQGAHRVITLKHKPELLPPQLQGRVMPQAWAAFMADVQALADTHPYVVKPSAGRVASWAGGAILGAVIGICCIDPDGGDWSAWLPQAEQVCARHQAAFALGGATLSVRRAQMSYWIQVDIDPAVAMGLPAAAPAALAGPADSHKPQPQHYPPGAPSYQQPYPPGAPSYPPGAPTYQQPYPPGAPSYPPGAPTYQQPYPPGAPSYPQASHPPAAPYPAQPPPAAMHPPGYPSKPA